MVEITKLLNRVKNTINKLTIPDHPSIHLLMDAEFIFVSIENLSFVKAWEYKLEGAKITRSQWENAGYDDFDSRYSPLTQEDIDAEDWQAIVTYEQQSRKEQ